MTGKQEIKIVPFKANRDRPLLPFKKGQGVSLAGWQFEVKDCRKNGDLILKCRGKITQMSEFAMATKASGAQTKPASTVVKMQAGDPTKYSVTQEMVENNAPCPDCGVPLLKGTHVQCRLKRHCRYCRRPLSEGDHGKCGVCTCKDMKHGLLDPSTCPVHGPGSKFDKGGNQGEEK